MDLIEWPFRMACGLLRDELPRRWAHVQGVADKARTLSLLLPESDLEMLVAAAVLHDIGYARSLACTGFHPLDGARYLRDQGIPGRLCALVAHHSCAYREAELRGMSAALAEWQDEKTPLRDALWWADMTTTPDGQPTNVHDRIEEIQKRYGPEDLVTFFIRQAKPELVSAVERTEERLRAARSDYTAK
ncbi:HD domain-containing protein [Lentzea sp. NPDC058450]|uniref:HD domain-containing protein n=1 Tax=Lentzea sp. NPDC058450 TaxID=3346505 RepID=UPI00365A06FB